MADSEDTMALTLRRRRPLYARAGVTEARLVDLEAVRVETYHGPVGAGYRDVRLLRPGEPFSPGAFPDLVVTLAGLVG